MSLVNLAPSAPSAAAQMKVKQDSISLIMYFDTDTECSNDLSECDREEDDAPPSPPKVQRLQVTKNEFEGEEDVQVKDVEVENVGGPRPSEIAAAAVTRSAPAPAVTRSAPAVTKRKRQYDERVVERDSTRHGFLSKSADKKAKVAAAAAPAPAPAPAAATSSGNRIKKLLSKHFDALTSEEDDS